jgi:plastocyanin
MDRRFSLGLVFVLFLAVLLGVIVARSQPQPVAARAPTPTSTPPPTPQQLHVDIDVNPAGNPVAFYNPATEVVLVGQKVTWVNMTGSDRTVAFDNGSYSSGVLSPGQKASWRAAKPGRYTYGDFLDPDIRGVVIVKP